MPGPHIGFDDLLVAGDRGVIALGQDAAAGQHRDRVGQIRDYRQIVLDHQHRAVPRDLPDQSGNAADILVAETGHRLVEQHHLGIERQRRGDLEGALAAIRQSGGGVLGEPGQPDGVEQRLGAGFEPVEHALGAPEMEGIAERPLQCDPDVLAHAQVREHRRNLERAHQAPSRDIGRPRRRDVAPVIEDGPGGRFEELGQQIEHGRLAGAVRADQRMDRAAMHPQIDPLHRGKTAELLRQTARLKDQIGQSGPAGNCRDGAPVRSAIRAIAAYNRDRSVGGAIAADKRQSGELLAQEER